MKVPEGQEIKEPTESTGVVSAKDSSKVKLVIEDSPRTQ